MSYIITAEVDTAAEENMRGLLGLVPMTILSERGTVVTFDVPGEFGKEQAHTKWLCNMLIEAGFVSFAIRHSY